MMQKKFFCNGLRLWKIEMCPAATLPSLGRQVQLLNNTLEWGVVRMRRCDGKRFTGHGNDLHNPHFWKPVLSLW
jgi:hypothetical protein